MERSAAFTGAAPIEARLEPDAISVAQDTFIGAALVGPSVSVALTLAALAATAAYAGPTVLILTAMPMIIIANSYRRLNPWNANCGASFEWVGRAINPYLGFMTGWHSSTLVLRRQGAERFTPRPRKIFLIFWPAGVNHSVLAYRNSCIRPAER